MKMARALIMEIDSMLKEGIVFNGRIRLYRKFILDDVIK